MPSSNFNPTAKQVLHGLCQRPLANDRELAVAVNIKLSTVTACKNRLKRALIYKKAYFPAYQRLCRKTQGPQVGSRYHRHLHLHKACF